MSAVFTWWSMLCVAAVFNSAAWIVCAILLARRKSDFNPGIYRARKAILWLSAVYVLGCAFRSILPIVDAPRMCIVDAWVARVFVSRWIATAAELCFVAQWAILLREAALATGVRFAGFASKLLLPLIVGAEISCWYAVLTRNYLAHAIENSLWTLSAALATVVFFYLRPHLLGPSRLFLNAAIAGALGYIAFMMVFDVPMYLSRWHGDLVSGRDYLAPLEGLRQTLDRCIVTLDWKAWRNDVPWMTLYFTLGVWSSIALALAPDFSKQVRVHHR